MRIEAREDQADGRATRAATVLVVGLFFLWGAANNLNDVLVAHFRQLFRLSDLQSGLVQSAFYLGYFCCAIPASLAAKRFGYKRVVIAGLLLFAAGALLFWPASLAASYAFFLLGLFVIASGLAFLETAANPMVMVLGSAEGAERRLNLAQAFNPLGSIAGVVLGAVLILAPGGEADASAVRLPYLCIALVVLAWAALLALTPFPMAATVATRGGSPLAGYGTLLRRPRYMAGVAAQFFYVGAQVGIWSYLIRYVGAAMPAFSARHAAGLLTLSLALFMAGRFVGTALLARIDGARLMLACALIDAALATASAMLDGWIGVAALVLSSFFMSILYPTIFVLSLRGLGPLTKPGASMIVMAIIGGAVITALMGLVSDMSGAIRWAMFVPAVCFLVVAGFARMHRCDRT